MTPSIERKIESMVGRIHKIVVKITERERKCYKGNSYHTLSQRESGAIPKFIICATKNCKILPNDIKQNMLYGHKFVCLRHLGSSKFARGWSGWSSLASKLLALSHTNL
jgi:hypothetical protein